MTKTVDNAAPNEGDLITYTVVVANAGPDDATNVLLADLLPLGVDLETVSTTQGTFINIKDFNTGGDLVGWTVGTLASGASATLTELATVGAGTEGSTLTNTAEVIGSDQADPDSTPDNNDPTEDDQDSAGIVLGALTGGRRLTIDLSWENAVPPSLGNTATGLAAFALNQGQKRICFAIPTTGLTGPVISAHIHKGEPGKIGAVVLSLGTAPIGCVSLDRDLIKAIRQGPEGHYVDLHPEMNPKGEVRGEMGEGR